MSHSFTLDAVLVFAKESDAHRVLEVLAKRFGRFGLTVHPEKTRMICFQRPQGQSKPQPPQRQGFDFLGFTHYGGKSRKGFWVVQHKTAKDRLARAVQQVGQWCRYHRHLPIREQYQALSLQLQGHYAYYGVTGNARSLGTFRNEVEKLWFKWLKRRGRGNILTWERFHRLTSVYPLPAARIVHSIYAAKP